MLARAVAEIRLFALIAFAAGLLAARPAVAAARGYDFASGSGAIKFEAFSRAAWRTFARAAP